MGATKVTKAAKQIVPLRLRDIVYPLSTSDFLTNHWLPELPLLSECNPLLVERMQRVPAFKSSDALFEALAAAGGNVMLFGPNKFRGDVPVSQAANFAEAGFAVYVFDVEKSVPQVFSLFEVVCIELGVPEHAVAAEAFVAHAGGVSSGHYDHDVNFQILITGKKKWRLAPNGHIKNPLLPYHPTKQGGKLTRMVEEAYAADGEGPTELPADSPEYIALPGSVMFLPRGHWHEVHTLEPSLAINIVFKGMTWAHALSNALVRRLHGHAEARAYVTGALAESRHLMRTSEARFSQVRNLALQALSEMTLQETVVGVSNPTYVWADEATPRTLLESPQGFALSVPAILKEPLSVDASTATVLRALLRFTQPFQWNHLFHLLKNELSDSITPQAIWNLTQTLADRGLLRIPGNDSKKKPKPQPR